MKKEIQRVCFLRSMANGEELDHSETPIYHHTIQMMIRALSREGSSEAADRKLALESLWLSGGRLAEVSFLLIRVEKCQVTLPLDRSPGLSWIIWSMTCILEK